MINKKTLGVKITVLCLLATFMVTAGLSCKLLSGQEKALLQPVQLTWWGVEGDSGDYSDLINAYRSIHPNISISYRKLRAEEFEFELINALAEDRGPDIFSIRNTWVDKYLTKIEPLPPKTTLAYEISQKSLGVKQETVIEVRDTASIKPAEIERLFVDVVHSDVVRNDKVYALPLSVDTLALFYNRDLLNAAGIAFPPADWAAFQQAVTKLTFQNNDGDLVQSGAAIGTAENVRHSADILSLLMMQNGAQMTSGRRATFGSLPPGWADRSYNPGPEAVVFYTDFSNSIKEVYTWNNSFPNSLDAFSQGQTAMMFGYQSDVAELDAKRQSKLNYRIAPMPQIPDRAIATNFASYWVNTVSNKSKKINEAWDFVQFIAQESNAKRYLDRTGKPTALRSLIEYQLENEDLKIFTGQLLTAKSWYHGKEASVVNSAFSEMIESISKGAVYQDAIELATQKIQQSL